MRIADFRKILRNRCPILLFSTTYISRGTFYGDDALDSNALVESYNTLAQVGVHE